MAQSLSKIYIHLIFSTKNRERTLPDEIRPDLHAYIGGTFKGLGCPAFEINTEPDHLHALFLLARTGGAERCCRPRQEKLERLAPQPEPADSERIRPGIPTRRRPPFRREGGHPFRDEGGHPFRREGGHFLRVVGRVAGLLSERSAKGAPTP